MLGGGCVCKEWSCACMCSDVCVWTSMLAVCCKLWWMAAVLRSTTATIMIRSVIMSS